MGRGWTRSGAWPAGLVAAVLLLLPLVSAGCEAPRRPPPQIVAPIEEETAPLVFAGIVSKIPLGTPVGRFTGGILSSCAPIPDPMFWGTGLLSHGARGSDWGLTVEGVLTDAGVNVLRVHTDLLARVDESLPNAELVLVGEIEKADFEVCEKYDLLEAESLNKRTGSATVEVSWRVYSTIERRVVSSTRSRGVGHVIAAQPFGVAVMLDRAIGQAAAALIGDARFRTFLTEDLADTPERRAERIRRRPRMTIAERPALSGSIRDNLETVQGAVAIVDAGLGHGSGFFIAPGVLLTNAHVVKGSRRVPVRLPDGRDAIGRVLRRDAARDVAVVQVDEESRHALPIRMRPVAPSEDVYALGAPIDRKLARTLSKGIVSALRTYKSGRRAIQADVDVHGGNSGGPLMDSSGNVVGITYAGYRDSAFSSGLNLFVPIADALETLNITLEPPAETEEVAGAS